MDLEKYFQKLKNFADERDWEQFHSPKNLAMALSVESAELLEHFQWMSEEDSRALKNTDDEKKQAVAEEVVDVFLYTLRLCQQLNIDLPLEIDKKMEKNAKKYPADLVRGSSKKYNEYKKR